MNLYLVHACWSESIFPDRRAYVVAAADERAAFEATRPEDPGFRCLPELAEVQLLGVAGEGVPAGVILKTYPNEVRAWIGEPKATFAK